MANYPLLPDCVGGQIRAIATGGGFANADGSGLLLTTATGWSMSGNWTVTGVDYLSNGTSALPSLAFTNSTTTGLYRSAADSIGIALAAVPALVISAGEATTAAATATAGTSVWAKGTNGGASTGVTNAGRGSPIHLAAGDGGAAAGSGNGGAAGGLFLNGGDGGTSGSGTAGVGGVVYIEGTAPVPFVQNVGIVALADTDATLTAGQMRAGHATVAAGATNRTKTTPTAAEILAIVPGAQVGSMLTLSICNLKAANTVTLGLGSGVTNPATANLVIAAGQAVIFGFVFTNVGSGTEAVTVARIAG